MNVLLSTTYFGPVQWYQKLYRADEAWIECCETFQKQTYRNRCIIATTQGKQSLTVPVERPSAPHISSSTIKDVRISDHGDWRRLHWNALQSAYGESPFFEFYEDDLRPFFERRWTFLFDFNEEIRQKICELIDIRPQVRYTDNYVKKVGNDYRETIQPKHPSFDADFQPRPYYQVYRQKHGFLPNLSILDLLLNMGPESVFCL